MTENVTYGVANEAAWLGKRIARKGWNGKNMFVFMRPADELEVGFIIDKVKSLPQSVKDFFAHTIWGANEETKQHLLSKKVKFSAYLCLYAADGSIVNGWIPSQTDMGAEDWVILD